MGSQVPCLRPGTKNFAEVIAIGRHGYLKNSLLWVRLPPSAPIERNIGQTNYRRLLGITNPERREELRGTIEQTSG